MLRPTQDERFTFGIPLVARASTANWQRVADLLELTLRSIRAQIDYRFQVLLAGHDKPDWWDDFIAGDDRFLFLRADWPPEVPTSRNDDGGRKKWLIKDAVHRHGGGLLMYCDADDWVDKRLVASARKMLRRTDVGGIVDHGVAIDFATLRAVRVPDTQVFEGRFHRICGSSTVGRIEPDSADPLRREPHRWLGSHHRWPEAAEGAGVSLARLPVCGAYLVNTSENHSETYGPFAKWRRTLSKVVGTVGVPVDDRLASRFGLDLGLLRSKSAKASPAPEHPTSRPSVRMRGG